MKNLTKFLFLIIILSFVSSCTVTNNLYVNNPSPMGKGKFNGYIGVGTGLKPKIDSVSQNGAVNFSNKIATAPILSLGGQYGLTDNIDCRIAIHFPFIVGGIGIRGGAQYSFLPAKSPFNAAIGVDLGYVYAKDSIKFLQTSTNQLGKSTNGAINADFFIPLSYRFSEHFSIIITPRYSFNAMYVKHYQFDKKGKGYDVSFPALTLGLNIYNIYLESTGIYYNNTVYPTIGIAVIIP